MFYPNLIVIGAMKAGTSSLHVYLATHPEIYASKVKELDYFLWNYNKGEKWYKSHFKENKKYRVESSPNYTKFYKDWEYAAKKMHKDIPNCKLIYILRDPVERTLSQCRHHELNPNQVIPEILKSNIDNELILNSQYHLHIKEFLKYFKINQLLILKFNDLKSEPQKVMDSISDFLDITPYELSRNIHSNKSDEFKEASQAIVKLNKYKLYKILKKNIPFKDHILKKQRRIFYRKPKIYKADSNTIKMLSNHFQNDIVELEKLTGMFFDEWKLRLEKT